MKKKLYLAVMVALAGAVSSEAGSAVDTFNNPVGEIGKQKQPDLFSGSVGSIGGSAAAPQAAQTAPVAAPAPLAAPVAVPAPQAAQPAQAAAPAPVTAPVENKVAEASAAPKKLWSYQPVKSPVQPTVNNKSWVRNPIDAFVLAPLEAKGLTPSPDADRAAYIRRATIDAWGVIPTPDEVSNFVNDSAPDAYEKLADRLLSSTKFGERQARRWLDLARYADSAGFQGDQTRPNF
ncbi:MAG: DUF1549 domain-containing protein, partial [Methylococcaceae bacterium]|nr:DUF1549 domain-containing protein [Methylococcaceae bacterium]